MTGTFYGPDLAYIQASGFGAPAAGAAPEIIRRLRSAPVTVRRVCELGCGAGPLTAALAAAGFETIAIDVSAELLAIAREAAPAARFVHGSIYTVEIPACEAVLAVGEPLTYHPEGTDADARIGDLFQRVAGALPPGGLFIFDVIESGLPSLSGRFWTSGDDWAVMSETIEDSGARTLTRNIEIFRQVGRYYRRSHEVHRVRILDAAPLCDRLARCGFSVETSNGYGSQALPPRRRAFFAVRQPCGYDPANQS